MRTVALLLILAVSLPAAPRRVVLLEELVRIDALRSRSYELPLPQQRAALELHWAVKHPNGAVRVLVVNRKNDAKVLDSGYREEGSDRIRLDQEGPYQVTIENRQQSVGHALVDLRIELIFGEVREPVSQTIGPSPTRRNAAIGISLGLFVGLIVYAGIQLGPTLQQRWGGRRHPDDLGPPEY